MQHSEMSAALTRRIHLERFAMEQRGRRLERGSNDRDRLNVGQGKGAERRTGAGRNAETLNPDDQGGLIKAIIDTPKGSRNKYSFDPQSGLFECGAALQAGLRFPFDFGFIPSTKGGDGDPLDVIVLMDEPAFTGCLVHVRLIGVMEAEQTEGEHVFRNDRLIAVHTDSVQYGELTNWKQLRKRLRHEVESFFVEYNKLKDKQFKVLGWHGTKRALKLMNPAAFSTGNESAA